MATELVRRNGPTEVPVFRQMMERFFDDPFFREPFSRLGMNLGSEEGTLPVDIYEKDNKLHVEASVPGFRKEDIDIQVHDGVLSIRAQRSDEREEQTDRYYRRERSWGAVSRRIALPGVVDDASVNAELKNGVLTLTIPLPEQASPKRIEIQG